MALAEELLQGAGKETSIAVVSAPSVFVQVKNLLVRFYNKFFLSFFWGVCLSSLDRLI